MEKKSDLKISITHLYPKLLNLYGDIGNIITLKKRCEWRGISVEFFEVNPGKSIPESDIYFIGGGQDKQQIGYGMCVCDNEAQVWSGIILTFRKRNMLQKRNESAHQC